MVYLNGVPDRIGGLPYVFSEHFVLLKLLLKDEAADFIESDSS